MAKRHSEAIYIQKGACNPRAIARAIVEATDEAAAEGLDTEGICNDPAVRLMIHQLAFLCDVFTLDMRLAAWESAVRECEKKGGIKLW